jgi:hypothetical protein
MSKANNPKNSLLKFKQKIQKHKFNPISLSNSNNNKRVLSKADLSADYSQGKRVKFNIGDDTSCRPKFDEEEIVFSLQVHA